MAVYNSFQWLCTQQCATSLKGFRRTAIYIRKLGDQSLGIGGVQGVDY